MSTLLELLKQKKQDLAAGNRKKTAKPTDGTTRWRILPSWRGEGQQFYHDFGQHFVKDATGKLMAIYMCSEKTYGKACPVCEAIHTGTKSASDDVTMNLLKEAGSAPRVLLNALHVDGPTPNEVQILELAPSAFTALINIACEWEEAGQSIFDAETGKDILITRTGAGKLTKYSVQVAAKAALLPPGVLAKLNNLDDYVAQESSEQQMRALNSVRAVSGLLSAPAPAGDYARLPAAAAAMGAATIEDDPYAVAVPPPKKAEPVGVTDAVVKTPVAAAAVAAAVTPAPVAAAAPAPAPAPVAAPAPAKVAVAIESTGDAELDEMLQGLNA